MVEEWKTAVERLPLLSNKVNFGLNALQFLYTHQDAKTAEGRSQDNFSIRRSELLAYGKINEFIPKWHVLFEFQSINFDEQYPRLCATHLAAIASAKAGGVPTAATFFRESYIDFRPFPSLAPEPQFHSDGYFSYAVRYLHGNLRRSARRDQLAVPHLRRQRRDDDERYRRSDRTDP
ncbi:MAG: hypothetical protein U0231_16185 [Nitrospiraceae bacterium]